jgi:hypothetical protein
MVKPASLCLLNGYRATGWTIIVSVLYATPPCCVVLNIANRVISLDGNPQDSPNFTHEFVVGRTKSELGKIVSRPFIKTVNPGEVAVREQLRLGLEPVLNSVVR